MVLGNGWGWVVEVDTSVSHTANLNSHPAERREEGRVWAMECVQGTVLRSTAASRGPGARRQSLVLGGTSMVDPGYCGCVCPLQNPCCTL